MDRYVASSFVRVHRPVGAHPVARLLLARDGKLYGTTTLGGAKSPGVVYSHNLGAPAVLSQVGFYPYRLWGGDAYNQTSTGTVVLDGLAPAGGVVVSLTSSRPDVIPVPSTVTVPQGWSTVSLRVTAKEVQDETAVTISATYNGIVRRATVTVYPLH